MLKHQSLSTTTVLFRNYVHSDDHAQPTYEMTHGLKYFTIIKKIIIIIVVIISINDDDDDDDDYLR